MLRTRLTETFSCRIPIMNGPMAGVAGGELAAAVARGGGMPFIAAGHGRNLEGLDREIEIYRAKAPGYPLNLGFITYSSFPQLERILAKYRPNAVQFTAPGVMEHEDNIKVARAAGVKFVFAQVGRVDEATAAIAAGVDCIITQGREAGGHGLRTELANGTLPLAAAVIPLAAAASHKPLVLAAGGVVDGRGLAAVLALGCEGAVMGTRFFATHEAMGSASLKAALVNANADATIRTQVFDTIANSYSATPWPPPYDSGGALHNSTSKTWHHALEKLASTLTEQGEGGELATHYKSSGDDPDVTGLWMGEGVGGVSSILSAGEVLAQAEAEAVNRIYALSSLVVGSKPARGGAELEEREGARGGKVGREASVVQVRQHAPSFRCKAVLNEEVVEVDSETYRGKYLVLFFYPLDWTFVCPTEIIAFSDAYHKFKKIGCELLGCSVDSVFSHLHWVKTDRRKGGLGGCKFALMSDMTHKIAQDYHVDIQGGEDAGTTFRGLFIISPEGVLRQITVNDLPVGRNPDEVLRLVQAFQFTDAHGEVCPASWRPGDATMQEDPAKSLEYFETKFKL